MLCRTKVCRCPGSCLLWELSGLSQSRQRVACLPQFSTSEVKFSLIEESVIRLSFEDLLYCGCSVRAVRQEAAKLLDLPRATTEARANAKLGSAYCTQTLKRCTVGKSQGRLNTCILHQTLKICTAGKSQTKLHTATKYFAFQPILVHSDSTTVSMC